MIAVNQFQALSVYDAIHRGRKLWSASIDKPDLVGKPLIADGTVFTTIGHPFMEDNATPAAGKVAAFDLRTGAEPWSQDAIGGYTFGSVYSEGSRSHVSNEGRYYPYAESLRLAERRCTLVCTVP